ncbi:hypothetical protein C8R45DRAFT_1110693 [Mycena sanguinolenta]|nr:hypothetical protein C8R45DRAFT_1110693 [Mycena sanguinolenta]
MCARLPIIGMPSTSPSRATVPTWCKTSAAAPTTYIFSPPFPRGAQLVVVALTLVFVSAALYYLFRHCLTFTRLLRLLASKSASRKYRYFRLMGMALTDVRPRRRRRHEHGPRRGVPSLFILEETLHWTVDVPGVTGGASRWRALRVRKRRSDGVSRGGGGGGEGRAGCGVDTEEEEGGGGAASRFRAAVPEFHDSVNEHDGRTPSPGSRFFSPSSFTTAYPYDSFSSSLSGSHLPPAHEHKRDVNHRA